MTLRNLAEALHGAGQPAAARAELATALRLAAETGNTYQQASVHRDLAESHHRAGEDEQARHHWQQALDPVHPARRSPRQTRSGPGSSPKRRKNNTDPVLARRPSPRFFPGPRSAYEHKPPKIHP